MECMLYILFLAKQKECNWVQKMHPGGTRKVYRMNLSLTCLVTLITHKGGKNQKTTT